MSRANTVLNGISRLLRGRGTTRCVKVITKAAATYKRMSDEDIVLACRQVVSTPKLPVNDRFRHEISVARLAGYKLEKADGQALALTMEAFSRFPPGRLPRGARIYEQQRDAAVHLLRGALVQMDTGEGKTFAIMIAAFALLRRYPKVYVLTANPYLALRDAASTSPFWSAIGVTVGVALPDDYRTQNWPGWEARVVYATANAFAVANLRDDLQLRPEERSLTDGAAVLIDEVDAILLESGQLANQYSLDRWVAPTTKDWSAAYEIASHLTDAHVKVTPAIELSATLTAAGEAEVLARYGRPLDEVNRLALYRDVELAYAAVRLAVEGTHYELADGNVIPLDAASGWPTPGQIPSWQPALEQCLGVRRRPQVQIMHLSEGLATLRRFPHVGGASGTVADEALEYVLLLGLPTVRIRPRHPRYRKGRLSDIFCGDLATVQQHLAGVVDQWASERPIMIVTSSSLTAQHLARVLAEGTPAGMVRFASGETIAEERLFEDAGRPGVVIVSTRVAGRGVDIRLTDEARANGGAILISVGHAVEARLDRQLLGRVGRQGDPFSAWFVNYPDDELMRILVAGLARRVALRHTSGDDRTRSRLLDKGVATAQRMLRRLRLQNFATLVARGSADDRTNQMLIDWWSSLQRSGDGAYVGVEFIQSLASAFVANHLPGVGERLNAMQGTMVINTLLGLDAKIGDRASLELQLIGQPSGDAAKTVTNLLAKHIHTAVEENRRFTEERSRYLEQCHGYAADCNLLHDLLSRIDESAAFGEPSGTSLSDRPTFPDSVNISISYQVRLSSQAVFESWIRTPGSEPPPELPEPTELPDNELLSDDILRLIVRTAHHLDDLPTWADGVLPRLVELIGCVQRARWSELIRAVKLPAANRTSKAIAFETIVGAVNLMEQARERNRFLLDQAEVSFVKYQHMYASKSDDLRHQVESFLVDSLCRNLLAGRDPDQLNQLFTFRDAVLPSSSIPTTVISWKLDPPGVVEPIEIERIDPEIGRLTEYFIKAIEAGGGKNRPKKEEILPALKALWSDSPLYTLTDPARVLEAMQRWRNHKARAKLLPWRRRKVDRCVRDFLLFLHQQGVAAKLPTGLSAASAAWAKRAAAMVKAPRFGVGITILVATAAFAGLLVVPLGLRQPGAGGAFALLDRLLPAGALTAGLPLGAGLLAVVGAAVATWLIYGEEADRGALPAERQVSIWLAVLGAALLTQPWTAGSVALQARAGLTGLAILAAAMVFRNATWMVDNLTQSRVVGGLTSGFVLAVAIPHVSGGTSRPAAVLLAAAAAIVLQAMLIRARRAQLPTHALVVATDQADDQRARRLASVHLRADRGVPDPAHAAGPNTRHGARPGDRDRRVPGRRAGLGAPAHLVGHRGRPVAINPAPSQPVVPAEPAAAQPGTRARRLPSAAVRQRGGHSGRAARRRYRGRPPHGSNTWTSGTRSGSH